jgi:lipoate-protein ligase A
VRDGLTWHLWLDRTPRPGWQNMSIDMALHGRAASTGNACLRFYRWDPSCLSFGRHEPAARRYDRDRIARFGIDTVRRPTGGRAVWHAGELTYAVAAPEAMMGSLRDTYARIHQTIADALRTLGARVHLAPSRRAPQLDAGACFAAAAGGEVVLDASKVVGSAQLRTEGALLQHGSVLLDSDQALLRDVSRGETEAPDVLPLSRILGRPVGWEEVALAIGSAARSWGSHWTAFEDEGSLISETATSASRFRDPEWTWHR